MRYEKIIINGQMQSKPFLIVIYRSSLVKAAMNAACVCKLRNGVNKTPQFLLFLKNKEALKILKGSRRMGGRRSDFSKNLPLLSL
jgi:hypothetical protein